MSLLPDFLAEEDICYSFSNVPEQKRFLFTKTTTPHPSLDLDISRELEVNVNACILYVHV